MGVTREGEETKRTKGRARKKKGGSVKKRRRELEKYYDRKGEQDRIL